MRLCVTIAFIFISTVCFGQTTYFFDAVNGNDNNSAAQAQVSTTAWKTINKANQFWSSLNAGDKLLFRRGQTFTGTFQPTKGGTAANQITVDAWGSGSNPVISGLTTVTAWTNLGGNIWESTGTVTTLDTVWVVVQNGIQQRMGRFPNWTPTGNEGYLANLAGSHTQVSSGAVAAGSWVNSWAVIKKDRFIIDVNAVTAQAGSVLTFTPVPAGTPYNSQTGYGFFIENSLATLDQQGEWFFNKATHKLDIFSTTNPGTVLVSSVNNLVVVNNRPFITWQNLQFQGANNTAFSLTSAPNNIIQNCNFLYNNNVALCFQGGGAGSASVKFQNDTCDWTNNIVFNPTAEFTGYYFGHNIINHTATFTGLQGNGDGQATALNGRGNNGIVEFNVVRNTGFNGLGLTGSNVFCRNNYVDSACTTKDDGANIYFQTTGTSQTTSWVSNNICTNAVGDSAGTNPHVWRPFLIYFDGGTINTNCDSNGVANSRYGGIFINTTNQNIKVLSNTAFNAIYVLLTSGAGSPKITTMTGNTFVGKATTDFTANHMNYLQPYTGSTFNNNVYARPINDNVTLTRDQPGTVTMTLAQWQTYSGQDASSTKSPKAIPDTTSNNIRFVFNATNSPTVTALPGTWIDMKSVSFPGSITLQPFTSKVLLFSTSGGSPLSATAVTATNPLTCFGNTTTITVNATGGTSPYTYSINGGGFSSTNVFTNEPAGTYTFQVKDAIGTIVTTQITITQPTQISISEVSGTITINGGTTTTTVTASGGTGTLQYKLDAGSFQPSNVFTGVGAGTHTITVRDGNNCTNTLTYTLTQPSVLTLSLGATTNPLLCFGATTTLTATASGGTTPYTYRLNGGTSQSQNTFTVGAGTWQVTVTDNAGAVTTQTLVISQPTQIAISESHTNIIVNGGNSTVTITASGGTGAKQYSLDFGTFQPSNVFNGVLAGPHRVDVKDANGCTNFINFTITQPTNLLVSASVTTPISCNGGTGTITVNAAGGTTPYTYSKDGVNFQSGNIFSGLVAATYTFTVNDAGGAVVSTSPITLTQPSQISISTSFGSAPTTVTVTASGGAGGFTYSLDFGAFQSPNTFANVGSGNHRVDVKDANGCTNFQLFSVGSTLGITLSVGTITCNGGSVMATAGGTGGTPPYFFEWSNGQPTSQQTLTAGTYNVKVTDNANPAHVHDTTFTITQPSPITFTITTGTISVNGGTTTVSATAVSGGAGSYTYSLNSGSFQGPPNFTGVGAGNGTITVKDASNCTKTQNFTLTQPGVLIISISRGSAILCAGGTQAITVGGTGGTTPYTFTVDNGTFTATTVYNSLAGTHTYSVKDAFGSRADTIITITQPTPLSLAVVTGTIIVNGGNTTATGTGAGGTGSLQYSLDGNSYQGSGAFTGVLAGQHYMTVKDANNCIDTTRFSISQPDALSMTATPTTNPLLCYGDVTTVTITKAGGTAPFTYGKNGVFGGSNTFTNLIGATYTFSVRDAFNAQHDTIITIGVPSQITLTQVVQFPAIISTFGGNADSVVITAAGGTPTGTGIYSYALDGGSYTVSDSAFKFTFFNVSGGQHSVSIKDANNCVQTYQFSVAQPPEPVPYYLRRKPKRHVYIQL